MERSRATAAEAAVKQAQARVDQAQLNLGYTKIVAPTTGIVNKKNVEVGANLSRRAGLDDGDPADRSVGDGELQGDAA